jgi:hypothetical protein
MAGRAEFAPVLAEHERRLNRITWAVYRVQRAILGPTNVARRIYAAQTGTRAEIEAAIQSSAHTNCETDEAGGVRRAWRRRRDAELPTTEEFSVVAPYIGREKRRPGFWKMWARASTND